MARSRGTRSSSNQSEEAKSIRFQWPGTLTRPRGLEGWALVYSAILRTYEQ